MTAALLRGVWRAGSPASGRRTDAKSGAAGGRGIDSHVTLFGQLAASATSAGAPQTRTQLPQLRVVNISSEDRTVTVTFFVAVMKLLATMWPLRLRSQ